MKKLIFILTLWISTGLSYAGNLVDIYKNGTLRLIADPTFAINTDWDTLFSDYFLVKNNNPIGTYKDIVISENGDIFISNYSRYNIYKLDRNGNYITQFGQEGRELGDFFNRQSLNCILDNQYLITNENNGRMNFFDLNGNFHRLIEIDYGVDNCIALNDQTIALFGGIIYSGMRMKYGVALKDIETGNEKFISSYMHDLSDLIFAELITESGFTYGVQKPFERIGLFMVKSLENNIIVGYSNSPEVVIYSPRGEEIDRFNLNINPIPITQKEKDEYYESIEKSITRFESLTEQNMSAKVKAIVQSPDFFPEYMPHYYYNLMTDSDGNILVFIYTNEPSIQKFQVYSPEGEYICETTIDPGIYNIDINSRFKNFVFHHGDLYCLAALKESSGIPLRLMKVNLSSVIPETEEGKNIPLVENGERGLWSDDPSKRLRIEEVQSIKVNEEGDDCIFSNIKDVAIAENGDLYVCDYNEPRIKVFNQNGTFIRKFGKKGDGRDELLNNLFIEMDEQNQLYIYNNQIKNPRISIFDLNGNFLSSFKFPSLTMCHKMQIRPNGEIIGAFGSDPFSSEFTDYIYHYDHEGNIIKSYSPRHFIEEIKMKSRYSDKIIRTQPSYSMPHMDMASNGDLYCALGYPYLIKVYKNGQLIKMIHRECSNFTLENRHYLYGLPMGRSAIRQIFCLPDGRFFLLVDDSIIDIIEDSIATNYFLDLFDSEGHFLKSYQYDQDKYGEIIHMDSEGYVYTDARDGIPMLVKYRFLFE
ncbi:6-bladed beta-propeller [bacterium]|nr:6-bladed beta-propeller [bacterium]RQV96625.1 MAG: 6-bladed beta-propeller [bacterium]